MYTTWWLESTFRWQFTCFAALASKSWSSHGLITTTALPLSSGKQYRSLLGCILDEGVTSFLVQEYRVACLWCYCKLIFCSPSRLGQGMTQAMRTTRLRVRLVQFSAMFNRGTTICRTRSLRLSVSLINPNPQPQAKANLLTGKDSGQVHLSVVTP